MKEFKDGLTLNIYGGKNIFSRRKSDISPYVVKVVNCEKTDICPLIKEGKCLGITGLGRTCKHAKHDVLQGTGYRAKSHYDLTKYRNHPLYCKLERPTDMLFYIVGDEAYMDIRYGEFKIDNDNKLTMYHPYYGTKESYKDSWFDKNVINMEFLTTLCDFRPSSLMGGKITDYEKEVLPILIFHISKYFPELVEEFINSDEKYSYLDSPIGKQAYLKTIKDGEEFEWNGNIFTKYSFFATCREYKQDVMPFGANHMKVDFDIKDDMIIIITDINQVDPKTKFID